MDRRVNLYEAKTQLSRLVDDAANGETIIIAKGGKPMAKLGPVGSGRTQPRKLGQLAKRARSTDWTTWWHDWKAADRQIEAEFETASRTPFPSGRRRRERSGR